MGFLVNWILMVIISNCLGLIGVAYQCLPSASRGTWCILLAGETSSVEAFRFGAMVD